MEKTIKFITIISWSKVIFGGSQFLLGNTEWISLVIWGILVLSVFNGVDTKKRRVRNFLILSLLAIVIGLLMGDKLGVNFFIFGIIDSICFYLLGKKVKLALNGATK